MNLQLVNQRSLSGSNSISAVHTDVSSLFISSRVIPPSIGMDEEKSELYVTV